MSARNALIRKRIAAGERQADLARELGISSQRVSQIANLRYVCVDHPDSALANVASIRADIWRPARAEVVGECEVCNANRRVRKLSYGKTEAQP